MKRVTAALISAAVAAALAGAGVPASQAGKVIGNWGVSKRAPAKARRPAAPRRDFNFFGIFDRGPRSSFDRYDQYGDRPRRIAVTPPPEKPKIYVYSAPRLVALSGNAPGAVAENDTLAGLIHDSLAQGVTSFRVTPGHRKAILKFYAKRGFRPVWTSLEGIEQRAFPVLERLARSGEEGLDPAMYRLPSVWGVNGDLEQIEGDAAKLAQLDIELTAAALRYAGHASGGVVNPNRLSAYHDLHPPRVGADTALKRLAESADPAQWLGSLLPRHRAYRIMRAALKRLGAGEKEEPLAPIAAGPLIRPGGYDTRLPLIREYLIRFGFLSKSEPAGNRKMAAAETGADGVVSDAVPEDDINIYDEKTERAVREFQRKSGLKPDGIIGKGTLRAFSRRRGGGRAARARKIALNMERLRWMPRDFGATHFLVNQPAFEVYLVRNGRTVWKTRVIIGKPNHQTAFFSDQMEMVVFNPYWGVPQSIITREMMPKLLRDPSYLDRKGFEVYNRRGQRVSSSSVDWYAYGGASKVPFDVRQPPGGKNALGHIKFLFPNKHSIYMHDTPSRSLFNSSRRAFSHGCVRVQNPLKLAELVTGLPQGEVQSRIDAGKNERMPLKRKIPVHLAYFTVWPDDAGRLHGYADVYGRDRLLDTAMKKTESALRVAGN